MARTATGVTIKSPQEIEAMRKAGRVVARVLDVLSRAVAPGMKTRDLDLMAAREIQRQGAQPAFLGYRGFPGTICASLNEEIVHGIPGDRVVCEGDLVKIDAGAVVDGLYADAAVTVPLGKVSEEARRLADTTRDALDAAIKLVRPGARLGDIGAAVQGVAEERGYSVFREYVGHGIGRALHEDPAVPNFGAAGRGLALRPGMAIAIEPMLNLGTWQTRVLEDEWTVVTADQMLSAHFEHTMIVTEAGVEVLTALNGEIP